MDDQQYIDIGDFIKGNYNEEQQKLFEQKIVDDPLFAEEVAHYISTVAIAKQLKEDDKKEKLKALYRQQQSRKESKNSYHQELGCSHLHSCQFDHYGDRLFYAFPKQARYRKHS